MGYSRWLARAVLVGSILLAGGTARAEPVPQDLAQMLSPSDRIRFAVAAGSTRLTGTVLEMSDDRLLIKVNGRKDPVRLSARTLEVLEVSRDRRSRAKEGALIGAVPGVLMGAFVGVGLACFDSPDCQWVEPAVIGGLATGAATAFVGACVGSAFKTERWVPVRLDRIRVGVAPLRGGAVATVAITF